MFAEGFEDYGYTEILDNTKFNAFIKHVDFSKMSGAYLVKTDTVNFKAHSGKYVLGVNGPSSLSFPIAAQPDILYGPTLTYLKDTTQVLNTLGGNYTFTSTVPKSVPTQNQGTASFSTTNPGLYLNILPLDTFYTDGTRMHYYSQAGYFYINIAAANTYSFNVSLSTAYNNTGALINSHSNGFNISITDSLGNMVSNYTLSQVAFDNTSATYTAFLCKGIYKVAYTATESYNATNNGSTGTNNVYNWSCSNSSAPDYKDLTKVIGCIYTRSMEASNAMQNPIFSIPPNKKMLFSAWVRENCGDPTNGIPCKDYTYTHNQVQLKFGGNVSNDVILNPTGAIIDGWQRYEGSFVAPAGAVNMTLNFVNSSTSAVYFDDVRIHPFNSNMKSYVYDPINLRLTAELDANNYASFYEYDEEGNLIRTKAETKEGIKTITESRSSMQKVIQ